MQRHRRNGVSTTKDGGRVLQTFAHGKRQRKFTTICC